MADYKILAQAAEAIIYKKDGFVIKDRIPKSYRLKILDDKIRKSRTKSETKLLAKAASIINAPMPIIDLGRRRGSEALVGGANTSIKMPFINGKKLSEKLNDFPEKEQEQICLELGKSVAKLHDASIIHGDLTTSNMILFERGKNKNEADNFKQNCQKNLQLNKSSAKKSGRADFEAINRASAPTIFFIDFGLGFISHKLEDKAVDLHLLKQALEAKHFQNWEKLFDAVIKGYSKSQDSKKVLERLKAVEKRGRYKH